MSSNRESSSQAYNRSHQMRLPTYSFIKRKQAIGHPPIQENDDCTNEYGFEIAIEYSKKHQEGC